MTIVRPVPGATGGGGSGSAVVGPVIYADAPPGGLSAVIFDDATDAKPALQAQMNYLSATYGGGTLVVSSPGEAYKILTSVTIPAKVQFRSDEYTLCDATAITSGPAFVVNDSDFTPIVGLRMDGGLFTPTSADLGSTYAGISVTGHGLLFEKLHLQYFGRGLDFAHNNTFICTVRDSSISRCATCVYNDIETAGVGNAGEKMYFDNCVIANAPRGFNVSAGGQSVFFVGCSIDFCEEFGRNSNAELYLTSTHLETGGAGAGPYLFDQVGNGHTYMSNCKIIMGGGRVGGLYYIFRVDRGPSNYGFGSVRTTGTSTFYVDQTGAGQTVFSEHFVSWPSNQTTATVRTPYALRWSPVTVQWISTDGAVVPNTDVIRISAADTTAGTVTLTAPALAQQRWAMVTFG